MEIFGDVGSNGNVNLTGADDESAEIKDDPPSPFENNGIYSGSVRAVGNIICEENDCEDQVEGTTTPYAPGTVCGATTMPTFSPGATNQTVTTAGWTMDATTGYEWDTITVEDAGDATGCTGVTPFSDLRIQTGAAGTTTVVQVRRLNMGRCGRLLILGDGNVELRVAEGTGQGLSIGRFSRFGMLSTDTQSTPAPAPAGRLTVYVQSTANGGGGIAAVTITQAHYVIGAYFAPNGQFRWTEDPSLEHDGNLYGAVVAKTFDASATTENDGDNFDFVYDPTVRGGSGPFGNFTRLMSWKDQ